MDVIGLNRQLDHHPVVLGCYFADDLHQPVTYRPDKHLAPPLGAPDDVVHDKVYGVPFVRVVHVDSIPFLNTARKVEGPFCNALPFELWRRAAPREAIASCPESRDDILVHTVTPQT